MYNLWSQVKQDEKEEQLQHLQEKVSIQHKLIKRQDELFKVNQMRLEQKRQQVLCRVIFSPYFILISVVQH